MPIGELTRIANKEIKQQLKRLPNVGQITTIGGREKKIWLTVDRDKLAAHGITLFDIQQAIQSQHLDLPAGRLTEGTQELQEMLMNALRENFWEDRNTLAKAGSQSVLSHLKNALKFLEKGGHQEQYERLSLAQQILLTE